MSEVYVSCGNMGLEILLRSWGWWKQEGEIWDLGRTGMCLVGSKMELEE